MSVLNAWYSSMGLDRVVPWVSWMGCSGRQGVGLMSEAMYGHSRPPQSWLKLHIRCGANDTPGDKNSLAAT